MKNINIFTSKIQRSTSDIKEVLQELKDNHFQLKREQYSQLAASKLNMVLGHMSETYKIIEDYLDYIDWVLNSEKDTSFISNGTSLPSLFRETYNDQSYKYGKASFDSLQKELSKCKNLKYDLNENSLLICKTIKKYIDSDPISFFYNLSGEWFNSYQVIFTNDDQFLVEATESEENKKSVFIVSELTSAGLKIITLPINIGKMIYSFYEHLAANIL